MIALAARMARFMMGAPIMGYGLAAAGVARKLIAIRL
jgi:hypothetical protein